MVDGTTRTTRQRSRWLIACVTLAVATGLSIPSLIGQQDFRRGRLLPIDPARELAMKVPGSFMLATVGDLIVMRPVSNLDDPGFQRAIKLVRDADLAFGNFEASIADLTHFDGPLRGFIGTQEVAADVKAMGFDLLNRANNHLYDSEIDGMWSTNTLLDEAALVHAGTGKNLDEARAAQYLDLPKGRVGLVGIHTPLSGSRLGATARIGSFGGLNALGLTPSFVVAPDELETLRQIRNAAYQRDGHISNPVDMPIQDAPGSLLMFGVRYTTDGTPGTKSYAMSPNDLGGILRSIRNGKMFADFMIATIHTHQGKWIAQRWAYEDEPPDFLIELAHKSIDNGADAFVGHGPHVLRGIEIYEGKPIFYGLGEFFRQMELTVPYAASRRPDAAASDLTQVELLKQSWERGDTRAPIMYESAVAVSRYEGGRLVEVRLYPTDLRFDEPISRVGVPRIARPEIGRRILERLQALSKLFGTTIAIEENVGVIRIASPTSSAGR